MGYSITVSVLKGKGENEKRKGIASVVIDKSFAIGSIAIVEGKKGAFISMPSMREGKDQEGKDVYKDVCHPITAKFRQELYSNILKTYEEALKSDKQSAKFESADIKDSPKLGVTVRIVPGDSQSIKGRANVVLNDNFIIPDIPIREGGEKGTKFAAMPSYKTEQGEWRNIVHPITREFADKLNEKVMEKLQTAEADKALNDMAADANKMWEEYKTQQQDADKGPKAAVMGMEQWKNKTEEQKSSMPVNESSNDDKSKDRDR